MVQLGYFLGGEVMLQGYTNSDWEGSALDRKSTSRCCFSLGSAMIPWLSKKQNSVALSKVESEYIEASVEVCKAIWLRKILAYLFIQMLEPTLIHCDNQSWMRLLVNPVSHDKLKHVEIKYHYIQDMV